MSAVPDLSTVTDSKTFSGIVDQIAKLSAHPGRQQDIARYVNATLKELNVKQHFWKSFVETEITNPNQDLMKSYFTWTPPTNLRKLRTVYYVESDVWPILQRPGKRTQEDYIEEYYYAATSYFVFVGIQHVATVRLGYYINPPKFNYYVNPSDRPAVYDDFTGEWYYKDAGTEEEKEAARNLVNFWIMNDWDHVVQEGAIAKFFKQMKDERAVSSFALYKSFQRDFEDGEDFESLGY